MTPQKKPIEDEEMAEADANDHEDDNEKESEVGDDEDEEIIPEELSADEEDPPAKKNGNDESSPSSSRLLTEKVERRESSSLPPLLSRLGERKAEKLNYIGVSFGATPKLIRFWKKAGYLPVYLRQTMVRIFKKWFLCPGFNFHIDLLISQSVGV